jgi:NAD(P)-dependent dehydrogenase (short-subunit alcohol dehydrogenase family)
MWAQGVSLNKTLGRKNVQPLFGKTIIVTGAGRGIGAACAAALAALGGNIVVNDIDPDLATEKAAQMIQAGHAAMAYACDVTDWAQTGAMVEFALDHFGTVDGLVNNAGLFAMGRLDEMRESDLRRILDVNVIGTANCAAHAVKPMLRQKRGSIVNVTSGAHMGIPAMGIYGATKGAVASFTYAWALELAGSGVRVNAVSPLAKTRMGDESLGYYRARGSEVQGTDILPEANAPVIAYLLSDEAAGVNGQIVRVEGRQITLLAHPAVLLPPVEVPQGGFTDLCRVFAEELAARQLPLGITGVKIEGFSAVSAFWKHHNSEMGDA